MPVNLSPRAKAIYDKVRKRYKVPVGTKGRIERVLIAAEDLAFIGAQRPEYYDDILAEYETALDRLFFYMFQERT